MDSIAVQAIPERRGLSGIIEAAKRALLPFLLSRFLIVAVFAIVPIVSEIPVSEWGMNDSLNVKLTFENLSNGLRRVAQANDAGWYSQIAESGYEHRPFDVSQQANWAFFPLHPMLWRGAASLTGEWFWSGVVLANAFAFAGLTLLWMLARRMTASGERADDAVVFACFWPASYFMVLPHTEALFFAVVTLSFLAAYTQRWWLAGAAGLFAGATRLNGLFLIPSLFWKWRRGDRNVTDLLKLAPIGLGLIGFMVYLWHITGNPLAFKDIQVTWGRELTLPVVAPLKYLGSPLKIATPWNPRLLHFAMTVLATASVVTCWKRGWRGLAVFTALTLLAPLATGTLMSMTRYLAVAPGVYMAMAVWAEKRRRWGQLCLGLCAASLTLLCTAFAAGVNIGGA